jgi:hypothetical protein
MINELLQRLKRRAGTVAMLLSLAALAACSTMSLRPWGESTVQSIEVVAIDSPEVVRSGLQCRLHNDKGDWQLAVPGTVSVTRSRQSLQIECVNAEGITVSQTDVPAIDERTARAKQQAKRGGIVGAGFPLLFFGAVALSPGGLVYSIATGAAFGGAAGAEQALADTATDAGFGYPARVELRF